jgi:hypothetical protein
MKSRYSLDISPHPNSLPLLPGTQGEREGSPRNTRKSEPEEGRVDTSPFFLYVLSKVKWCDKME